MNPIIDRASNQKLYLQLYEILKKDIEDGKWPVGAQIPTEKNLCEEYNVSKATVRLAIAELVRQGYLNRQQGKGTFVFSKEMKDGIPLSYSFKESHFDERVNFSTRVIVHTVMMPVGEIIINLDIPMSRHIIYIKRLRLIDNKACLIQEDYIPHNFCPMLIGDDITANSLIELIEKKCNCRITNIQHFINIGYLNKEDADYFDLPKGSPALLIERIFYSGTQRLCYSRSLKRPDRLVFFFETRDTDRYCLKRPSKKEGLCLKTRLLEK